MAENLTVLELIQREDFRGIDFIYRFPKIPILQRESVSKHSWWVSVITTMLLDSLLIKEKIELLSYYQYCFDTLSHSIFSDTDELISGDIDFTVKYNSHNGDEFRKVLQTYVENEMESRFGSDSLITTLSKDPQEPSMKAILKLADWFALLKQLIVETSLGNRSIEKVYEEAFKGILYSIDRCERELKSYFTTDAINIHEINKLKFSLNSFINIKRKQSKQSF